MENNSPFQIVFWTVAIIVAILFTIPFFIVTYNIGHPVPNLSIIFISLLIMAAIMVTIGCFVFNDAKKLGMDPWLWTTVAVFVPDLIGVVIYLFVRYRWKNTNSICTQCGTVVRNDFQKCPHCGTNLKDTCKSCKKVVEIGWKVCPYCGENL